MKRVAAKDAFCRVKQALPEAVVAYCFDRVGGAGGKKTAAWRQEGRQAKPVKPYQSDSGEGWYAEHHALLTRPGGYKARQLPTNILVTKVRDTLFTDDNDIPRCGEPTFIQPEKLSYQTFYPIAADGVSCLFADRDSYTSVPQVILMGNNREVARVGPFPLLVYRQII